MTYSCQTRKIPRYNVATMSDKQDNAALTSRCIFKTHKLVLFCKNKMQNDCGPFEPKLSTGQNKELFKKKCFLKPHWKAVLYFAAIQMT